MAIIIKTNEQIELMRIAGKICAKTHEKLAEYIKPGVTTGELNEIADDFIKSNDATATFLGYRGFPKSICASINEEVIHGIPGNRKLKSGDIISIDIGVCYKRYHGDAARTHAVGQVSEKHQKLIDVTKQSFYEGIKFATAENRLHDISAAIGDYVDNYGFGVVTAWCGHGIGRQLHEDPSIPHTRQEKRGVRLKKGMTLAIEPMINAGTFDVSVLDDTWTVITADGEYSAHYENTILITDSEPEVLTIC